MSQTVEVPLTHGQCAIIDAADAEIVAGYRWKFLPSAGRRKGYAVASVRREGRGSMVSMHRLIAETPDGLHTDHVNGNGLDNRRANLRHCTPSQNAANRLIKPGSLKGVSRIGGRFIGRIYYGAARYDLGSFQTEKAAALAYDAAARILHEGFAVLNFPDETAEMPEIQFFSYARREPDPRISRYVIQAGPKRHLYNIEDDMKAAVRRLRDLEREWVRFANRHAIRALPPRTAAIVSRRLAGETLQAIGDDLRITRERVRQIEKAGMAGLKAPRVNAIYASEA